ncbi:hypothetical protein [Brevundimonas sp. FT23042]|uniref:hypothetical protein n=1 Tax=Brevundimonas sp. FT23042 TaxID=3393749 RepID=UPI003B58A6F3
MRGNNLKQASLAMASALSAGMFVNDFGSKDRSKAKIGMQDKKVTKNRNKNKKARKARRK